MGVDLLHHVETVLEAQPLPRVFASSTPVILDLARAGQRIESHALQVGIIQVASHAQRPLGAPVGGGDFFRGCLPASAAEPERKEALGGEVRCQRPFIGHLLGNRASFATKISHRRFRQPIGDRSLRPHVDAEQSGEDLQLLRRWPTLLATQTQRRSISLDNKLAGLAHPAETLVKVG